MSFFGHILMEKGKINAQDLTEALILQAEELGSSIRICREESLVKDEELLEAIFLSAEQHLTIPQALLQLQVADQEKIEQIKLSQRRKRRPLGQILVDKMGLSLQELAPILSEHSQRSKQANPQESFDFHFPEVQGETKKQYLEYFTTQLKTEIEQKIHELGRCSEHQLRAPESPSMQLEEQLQQLSAAAGFARMEISRHLADKTSLLIEGLNSGSFHWTTQGAPDLTKDLLSSLDVLWELQRFIAKSGSEKEFWNNTQSQENFLNIYQKLERHLAK